MWNSSQGGDTIVEGDVGLKLIKISTVFSFAFFNHILLSKYAMHCNVFCDQKVGQIVVGLLSRFLLSKPPGRRMITSDVQTYFIKAFQLANFSLYSGIISRLLFGYFPSSLVFLAP